MPRSPLVLAALEQVKRLRAEYELVIEAEYEKAAEACRDNLVNAEGRRRGVKGASLFLGPEPRALRWASEELVTYWRVHPRRTFEDYERAYVAGLYDDAPDELWGERPA